MELSGEYLIHDSEELASLYGQPLERSVRKQRDRLDQCSRAFIAASPLVIISTQGSPPDGIADNSPRGDFPGFVRVEDDRTLLIPDRRGNNRLDTLRNIVSNPAVGLLFLVPGVHETFRVNGDAFITREPAIMDSFSVQGKQPRTVVVVRVKEAYIHCSRALVRADLWNPTKFAAPGAVPSFGTIMAAHTCGFVDAQVLDEENRVRVPMTLY
jgi:PPOX class probable FMN-dependent enzyme